MTHSAKTSPTSQDDSLSASVQILPLPPGLYLFAVTSANRALTNGTGQLALPAIHVGLGPGVRPDQVEFIAGPSTHGAWLFAQGDLLVTKVNSSGAALILTSIRAPGGEVLAIKVERLDTRTEVTTGQRSSTANAGGSGTTAGESSEEPPLRIQIGTHIRTRGDLTFADVPWAGRVAPGLWIESFSVHPLERFGIEDVEYKGLTGTGFETPWLSDGKMCGTKGMSVPLVAFAIRLKPGAAASAYDCEYSGFFQSGTTVGPLRNGAPCRSTVANDPLEGIQLRIVKRWAVALHSDTRDGVAWPERESQPEVTSKVDKARALKASKRKAVLARTDGSTSRPTRRVNARRQ